MRKLNGITAGSQIVEISVPATEVWARLRNPEPFCRNPLRMSLSKNEEDVPVAHEMGVDDSCFFQIAASLSVGRRGLLTFDLQFVYDLLHIRNRGRDLLGLRALRFRVDLTSQRDDIVLN